MRKRFAEMDLGFSYLLTPAASNPKTAKQAEGVAIEAVIQHFAPATLAHRNTVCPWSTEGCREGCLNTSGRSQVRGDLTTETLSEYGIHRARAARTRFYWEHRADYLDLLFCEIGALKQRADRLGALAAARLNGTSDVAWEKVVPDLFFEYPKVRYYDYTKSFDRAVNYGQRRFPSNYHLTYSRDEHTTFGEFASLIDLGVNVAVVFSETLPETYCGAEVIDGNEHDYRFLDRKGVVVGLTAKARAKVDTSGFVIYPREGV